MAVITISRGSYSHGKEVAEKVAERMGHRCIAREVLLEASKEFNIPEIKLLQAVQDAPSILERITSGKERYIAYFQATFLKSVRGDNVVYHGLAGHYFLSGISHALKVRIIADMEDRIRLVTARNGVSEEDALADIRKTDEVRRKWSLHLYGIDASDLSLYDLVVHIGKIRIDDAVDIICHTAGLESFRTTFESQKAMDDLVIASEVRASLIGVKPDVRVSCKDGKVIVKTRMHEDAVSEHINTIAREVRGVKSVEVKLSRPRG